MKFIYLFLLTILFFSCTNSENTEKKNVGSAVGISLRQDEVGTNKSFHDIFEVLDIVVLNPKNPIAEVSNILFSDASIYILDKKHDGIQFFQKDGTYKGSVGRIGQGEGEFTSIADCFINEYDKSLYVLCDNERRVSIYSLDGKYLRKIPFEFFTSGFSQLGVDKLAFYTNYNYSEVAGNNNIVITNEEGKIISRLEKYVKSNTPSFDFTGGVKKHNNNVLYTTAFNDTIFEIQPDHNVTPKYVMIPARPNEQTISTLSWDKLMQVLPNSQYLQSGFVESNNILFFDWMVKMKEHKGFYLKKQKATILDNEFHEKSLFHLLRKVSIVSGDTLVSLINTEYLFSLNNKEEYLEYIKTESSVLYEKLMQVKDAETPVLITYTLKK